MSLWRKPNSNDLEKINGKTRDLFYQGAIIAKFFKILQGVGNGMCKRMYKKFIEYVNSGGHVFNEFDDFSSFEKCRKNFSKVYLTSDEKVRGRIIYYAKMASIDNDFMSRKIDKKKLK